MNENNAKTMYEAVPAASELNKVPGFDPLKFLRRTKDTLKLDLPYQKLWFRMAHPNGRMRLTALRITEQMAIFEAKVFLDRSDAEPFSMSTAQQTTQDSRDFVKAAQNEALSQALKRRRPGRSDGKEERSTRKKGCRTARQYSSVCGTPAGAPQRPSEGRYACRGEIPCQTD